MPHEFRYATTLEWIGSDPQTAFEYSSYSRDYQIRIEGKPVFRGTSAPEFRGDPGLWNPEDLLVMALSSCHMLSYLALAANQGLHVVAYRDDATATMKMTDGRIRFVEATLRPAVTLANGSDEELARRLHAQANQGCFIAGSVNFPVHHQPTIVSLESS